MKLLGLLVLGAALAFGAVAQAQAASGWLLVYEALPGEADGLDYFIDPDAITVSDNRRQLEVLVVLPKPRQVGADVVGALGFIATFDCRAKTVSAAQAKLYGPQGAMLRLANSPIDKVTPPAGSAYDAVLTQVCMPDRMGRFGLRLPGFADVSALAATVAPEAPHDYEMLTVDGPGANARILFIDRRSVVRGGNVVSARFLTVMATPQANENGVREAYFISRNNLICDRPGWGLASFATYTEADEVALSASSFVAVGEEPRSGAPGAFVKAALCRPPSPTALHFSSIAEVRAYIASGAWQTAAPPSRPAR